MPKPRKLPVTFDFEPADEFGLYRSEWAATKQQGKRCNVGKFDADVCRVLNAAPVLLEALQSIALNSYDAASRITANQAIAKVVRRHA